MATNTQFALGVHMLTLLAGSAPATLSSEQMAGSADSNPVHVRRVLGRLRTAGLVTSKPGVGGGWQLAADPASITLADVWRVVHGDDAILGLRGANPACPVGQSIQGMLVDVDRRAQKAVEDELATTTIAALVVRAAQRADLHAHA
ncbi:MAG TPA: Rrf2 family transcriptional regulator [Baekduia sp.]|nr:Rrf2 family transcriptional regulator [Baekduia sp.]